MKQPAFKSKDMAKKPDIKKIPIPVDALPRLKELLSQVQLFRQLQGCEQAFQNTIQGVALALGIKDGKANVNLEEGVFEVEIVETKEDKKEA